MRQVLAVAIALSLTSATSVHSQEAGGERGAVSVGLLFPYGQTTGRFGDFVRDGYGAGFYLRWRPDRLVGVRADVLFVRHDEHTQPFPLSPNAESYLATSARNFSLMLGPQFTIGPAAQPVRLYFHGGLGMTIASVTSHVSGSSPPITFGSSSSDDLLKLGGQVGGGVLVSVGRGVALDLGARYLSMGEVEYVITPQNVFVTLPPCTVLCGRTRIFPTSDRVSLMVYHVGVVFRR